MTTDPIIKKIIEADKDTYVIFFVYGCGYCNRALDLIRKKKVAYKGYDINELEGKFPKLLKVLNDNAQTIGFKATHRTKPIIFKNGKFIGGMTELEAHFMENKKQENVTQSIN